MIEQLKMFTQDPLACTDCSLIAILHITLASNFVYQTEWFFQNAMFYYFKDTLAVIQLVNQILALLAWYTTDLSKKSLLSKEEE